METESERSLTYLISKNYDNSNSLQSEEHRENSCVLAICWHRGGCLGRLFDIVGRQDENIASDPVVFGQKNKISCYLWFSQKLRGGQD